KSMGTGGSMVARLKLKGIDGGTPPGSSFMIRWVVVHGPGGNNRSVMPLDVLGRTRATLPCSSTTYPERELFVGNLVKTRRAGDRPLQLLDVNEEFLVSASHQLALIKSLCLVHTARR
ncbi:hypothetical protein CAUPRSCDRAFT_6980, partial [Caulochytrium protostelioides]